MKTRFSSIDIRTTVSNLQKTLLGLRLANVYDLSPRVFLFKFSKPDCKKTLIIESGVRIHSTNFIRDKRDNTPAPFSLTLRKYLKTKRLENVSQLGVDRVVRFTFGSGVAIQYLIIELYSIGNIILTDGDYKILAILRTHQYNQDEAVSVGDVYPVDKAQLPTNFTDELVDDIVKSYPEKKESLKQVFNKSLDFGPELVEHCLLTAGIPPSTKLDQYDHSKNGLSLLKAFKDAQSIYNVTVQAKGFIILKDPKAEKPGKKQQQQQPQQPPQQSNNNNEGEQPKELVMYEEFVPYLYKQYESKKFIEFESFDLAVDQFFSEIESQKIEQQRIAQEQNVLKKLDKVKEEHQKRIETLLNAEEFNVKKANLIELNIQDVDQCIKIIKSGVDNGMDWTMLSQLLKEEKKRNPYSVANKIQKLKLDQNKITLLLSDLSFDDNDEDDESDDDDSDEEDNKKNKNKKNNNNNNNKPVAIDVDLSLSALANAKTYYDTKKKSHDKAQKTISQTENALKAAEKKTRQQLLEVNSKSKSSMTQMRKVFWFEKFHWFISSDNYLVISGKDAQQNELLFKRYLEKDDVYVHADIFGSTSCVIKNPNGGEIPPNTLTQAGTMTMCYSNAWSAKVVTSAYWVYSNQVSKTAPSGEYLTTGSFMIRGKKNYLPHSQLIMGFGFMFKLDDSCIGNHINDRKSSYLTMNSENDEDVHDIDHDVSGKDSEKHLRKFERSKLKKEQKELEEIEQLANLEIKEKGGNDTKETATTTTTTTTTTPTNNQPTKKDDKFRVKLVSSFQEDLEEEKNEQDKPVVKKHLSAHQRKILKKQQQKGTDANEDDEQEEKEQETKKDEDDEEEDDDKKENNQEKPKKQTQKPLTPSQKNKLKKIKDKYGHQDEEERKERMEILGSAGNKNKSNQPQYDKQGNIKTNKKDKKDKNKGNNKGQQQKGGNKDNNNKGQQKENEKNKETPSTTVTDTTATTTTTSTSTSTIANTITPVVTQQPQPVVVEEEEEEEMIIDNNQSDSDSESEVEDDNNESKIDTLSKEEREALQEKRRLARKEKKEAALKEKEEIQKILEEENSSRAVDPKDISTNIDTLTGQPIDIDILHFAIPVIAPYSVFNNYKYKVKLTPGHMKRGKAAKQACAVLLQLQSITKIEKDLIKQIKDEDLSANMLSDVRIHAPNLLATKKQEKKEKKLKAIEKSKNKENKDE